MDGCLGCYQKEYKTRILKIKFQRIISWEQAFILFAVEI